MTSRQKRSWLLFGLVGCGVIVVTAYLFIAKPQPQHKSQAVTLTEQNPAENLTRLLADARAKASRNDVQDAFKSYDAAAELITREFESLGGQSPQPELTKLYGQIIGELNELIDRVQTSEYEARVP